MMPDAAQAARKMTNAVNRFSRDYRPVEELLRRYTAEVLRGAAAMLKPACDRAGCVCDIRVKELACELEAKRG